MLACLSFTSGKHRQTTSLSRILAVLRVPATRRQAHCQLALPISSGVCSSYCQTSRALTVPPALRPRLPSPYCQP
uniref:Uncharacterized protein n=1 Tax=Tanacetum cinerariifolium TaxID=118510 RepID=A0A699XH95_TANCI|nr:hypothetical protein [Tanacetum cinerariifolium]